MLSASLSFGSGLKRSPACDALGLQSARKEFFGIVLYERMGIHAIACFARTLCDNLSLSSNVSMRNETKEIYPVRSGRVQSDGPDRERGR